LKLVKIFGVLGILLFSFLILMASIWRVSAKNATLNFKVTPVAIDGKFVTTPTEAPLKKSDYFLVYPGILPDSPFYPLKMVRDRIVLILTLDPLKKAEVMLLYADKRLGAGKALIEGGKIELGVATIVKGEKYLLLVGEQIKKAQSQGKKVEAISERLGNACRKHEEIIAEIKEKTSGDSLKALEDAIKYPAQVCSELPKE